MNDQRKILESIVKYAAVSTLVIFVIRYGLRSYLGKEIFTPSGIRILLMGCSFFLVSLYRRRIPFDQLAILTILTVYFGLIAYPLYGFPINIGGLMIFLVSLIMASIIPIAIYHPVQQKRHIFLWNGLIVASFFVVLSQAKGFLNPKAYESLIFLMEKELMLGFAFFGSYLTIDWIIYQYQLMNYNSQEKTAQVNEEIQSSIDTSIKQAAELNEKKKELKKAQEELLNARTSLEEKVKEETRNVDEKTKLLLKLSFINSHYLRVPISRIKSVLQVWNILSPNKRITIIDDSINELRLVIDAITKINEESMDVQSTEEYLKEIQLNQPQGGGQIN